MPKLSKKSKTFIHVNQHVIRSNKKHGKDDPVITIKQGSKLEQKTFIINKERIIDDLLITNGKLTKDATIHYNYTLKENLDIPTGLTLTVGEGAKLFIPDKLNITIKPDGKFKQEKNLKEKFLISRFIIYFRKLIYNSSGIKFLIFIAWFSFGFGPTGDVLNFQISYIIFFSKISYLTIQCCCAYI